MIAARTPFQAAIAFEASGFVESRVNENLYPNWLVERVLCLRYCPGVRPVARLNRR